MTRASVAKHGPDAPGRAADPGAAPASARGRAATGTTGGRQLAAGGATRGARGHADHAANRTGGADDSNTETHGANGGAATGPPRQRPRPGAKRPEAGKPRQQPAAAAKRPTGQRDDQQPTHPRQGNRAQHPHNAATSQPHAASAPNTGDKHPRGRRRTRRNRRTATANGPRPHAGRAAARRGRQPPPPTRTAGAPGPASGATRRTNELLPLDDVAPGDIGGRRGQARLRQGDPAERLVQSEACASPLAPHRHRAEAGRIRS